MVEGGAYANKLTMLHPEGQNSTFAEHDHVVYKIKGNDGSYRHSPHP